MEPLAPLALAAALLSRAHGRAINCTISGNDTDIDLGSAAGIVTDDLFNVTSTNGTCPDVGADEGNDLGMVKVGVLTAVLVVVMISTCRLLFKMYAQFGMRDSPDGTDKAFGE
ncbi:uncharacterized protein LOC122382911 [Amphibalanus amphitrite]|uniref:uncharacterized protein LOC122378536 n=1 Tax=Amphibalanus amphitrite TaxID=1232801 RepID=UPI001C918D5D|nr:uncharacterized protein LOC122378536 [Amphibalanus amphitrite]XP_043224777.1 uncharacterized protein LOC122382911 [Amphibalanus amphitrite]